MARRDTSLSASQEKAVIGWAKNAPMQYLACRTYGHTWTEGISEVYRINGDYVRDIACSRCGMRRIDSTPVGEYGAVRRSYLPPAGYRRDADDSGTARTPRWAIVDAIVDRSEVRQNLPGDLVDWYYHRNQDRAG